jgi:hypothetical protein
MVSVVINQSIKELVVSGEATDGNRRLGATPDERKRW